MRQLFRCYGAVDRKIDAGDQGPRARVNPQALFSGSNFRVDAHGRARAIRELHLVGVAKSDLTKSDGLSFVPQALAAGAAHAQSSVTVYGIVDVGYGYYTDGNDKDANAIHKIDVQGTKYMKT